MTLHILEKFTPPPVRIYNGKSLILYNFHFSTDPLSLECWHPLWILPCTTTDSFVQTLATMKTAILLVALIISTALAKPLEGEEAQLAKANDPFLHSSTPIIRTAGKLVRTTKKILENLKLLAGIYNIFGGIGDQKVRMHSILALIAKLAAPYLGLKI